jgi:Recombinase
MDQARKSVATGVLSKAIVLWRGSVKRPTGVLRGTRSALAAAKAQGKRLGGFRGRPGTAADCAKAREARSASADARAADLAPVIEGIRAAGANSLGDIARELNARDISAPRGGQWSPAQVRLLVKRLQHQSLGQPHLQPSHMNRIHPKS